MDALSFSNLQCFGAFAFVFLKHPLGDCGARLVPTGLKLRSEAQSFCIALATSSRNDTAATLARIDKLGHKNEKSMAGYLVYLNRYAFFAGKLGQCESQVRQIETATHRLRQELRECRAKGLL